MRLQELRQKIGANVARLRELRGWQQQELASFAGVSNLSPLENGDRVGLRTVAAVARALGVPISVLCRTGRDDDIDPELAAFLDSPEAAGLDEEETDAIVSMMMQPNRRPTRMSCTLALAALRAMRTEKK